MKKVVAKLNITETLIDSTSEAKYYGVERFDGVKGFLSMVKDRGPLTTSPILVISRGGVTIGDNWNHLAGATIPATIRNLYGCGSNFCVYEFDTDRELFAWLAK